MDIPASHFDLNLGYASVAGGFLGNRGAEMQEGHRGLGPTRTETGHDRWGFAPAGSGSTQPPTACFKDPWLE